MNDTIPRLTEQTNLGPDGEAHYAFTSTEWAGRVAMHCHTYFEIFLVTDGAVRHTINGAATALPAGTLVFIRPDDRHRLEPLEGQPGHFANLEFPRHSVLALFDYLGEGFGADRFLGSADPPQVALPAPEREELRLRLEALNALPRDNKPLCRTALRSLLFDICTKYFGQVEEGASGNAPGWLVALCRQMLMPANLSAGLGRMVELSHRTHEHLCRAFRKTFDTTPSAFVNDLRLNYAANLLRHTDRTITDIVFEAGYGNLTYFYRRFAEKFGMSPRAFRRKGRTHPPKLFVMNRILTIQPSRSTAAMIRRRHCG